MKQESKLFMGLMVIGLVLMAALVYQGIAPVQASGEVVTPFFVQAQNTFPTSTPHADGSVYHTVASGETLVAIAQEYDVDLQELLALNNLDDKDIIHPGDILLIRRASPEGMMTATAQAFATLNPGATLDPAGKGALPGLVGMVQGTQVVMVAGTPMLPVGGTLVPELNGTPVAGMMQMVTATGALPGSPSPTPTLKALLPDTLGTPAPVRAEGNVFQRVFSGSSRYLGLGVLGLVLLGLFLVVVSTRRMRP